MKKISFPPIKLNTPIQFTSVLNSLPQMIAALVSTIAAYIQCDPATVFYAFLGVLAAATVGRVVFKPMKNSSHVDACQLYIIISAASGERKNSTMSLLIKPLESVLKQLHSQAKKERQLLMKKAQQSIAASLNSPASFGPMNVNVMSDEAIDAQVKRYERIISDITLEGLARAQSEGNGTAILFNGEGDFLRILTGQLYSQHGAVNLSNLLNSYDNEPLAIYRSGREIIVPHASLSICIGTQFCVLQDFLINNVGRGLHERFLYCLSSSLAGTRSFYTPELDPDMYQHYCVRIEELAFLNRDSSEPFVHPFSEAAEAAYASFFGATEARMCSDGDLSDERIIGWAQRCRTMAVRIAGLLSLFLGESEVSVECWKAAEAVILEHAIPCAKAAFGVNTLSCQASRIATALTDGEEISQADLYRKLHNRSGFNRKAFRDSIAELNDAGLIHLTTRNVSGKRGAKPSPMIHVHPELSKIFN